MAPTISGPRLSPLAAYLNDRIRPRRTTPGGLAEYLAISRAPGKDWKSFDTLADTLTRLTDRPINRVSLKNFAALFEIPDTRYNDNHKMPRDVSADVVDGYLRSLNPHLIDVEAVREHLLGIGGEQETAAILADPDTMSAIADGEADLHAGHYADTPAA